MVALKDETDFRDNPYLFLMLGPACNMCCRHCSQEPYKGKSISDTVSDDVMRLLDSYIRDYQSRKSVPRYAKILFWGGEALLHWDLIEKVVPYFSEKYGMMHDGNVKFCIASNGILLTDGMVDFCNRYDVQFNLSFDAPYPFAVRGYVPEEQVRRAMGIGRLVVLNSMNAINCDMYAGLSCMRKKFFGKARKFSYNFQLFYNAELPSDILSFDFAKVRRGLRMCRIAVQMGDRFFVPFVFSLLKDIRYPEKRLFMPGYNLRHCVPGRKYLTVTLDGKVVRCHNDASDVVGTVDDSFDDIHRKGIAVCRALQGKAQTEKCASCEHIDVCPGGCMLGLRDADGCYRSCDLYTKPIYSILKEEMSALDMPLSDADRKWFIGNWDAYNGMAEDYAKGIYRSPSDDMGDMGL